MDKSQYLENKICLDTRFNVCEYIFHLLLLSLFTFSLLINCFDYLFLPQNIKWTALTTISLFTYNSAAFPIMIYVIARKLSYIPPWNFESVFYTSGENSQKVSRRCVAYIFWKYIKTRKEIRQIETQLQVPILLESIQILLFFFLEF